MLVIHYTGRGSSTNIESLQSQNDELREVIKSMRIEMEEAVATVCNNEEDDHQQQRDNGRCSRSQLTLFTKCYGNHCLLPLLIFQVIFGT